MNRISHTQKVGHSRWLKTNGGQNRDRSEGPLCLRSSIADADRSVCLVCNSRLSLAFNDHYDDIGLHRSKMFAAEASKCCVSNSRASKWRLCPATFEFMTRAANGGCCATIVQPKQAKLSYRPAVRT